jgi:hypothetical protein
MKPRFLTLPSALACLLLSVAAVLPSEPWATPRSSHCRFEARVESDRSGLVQLYYDTGEGMSEPASVLQPIAAGRPGVLTFTLPYGRFRALRFDPLDRDGRLAISGARIADGSGRTLVAFGPGQFQALNEIKSLGVRDGKLLVETEPGATDPQLWINLTGPFTIARPPLWRKVALVFAGSVAGLLILGWAWGSGSLAMPRRARSLWAAAGASPGSALALVALLATLAANYPVAFAGRSLVSPNLGVALLYGQAPWLPGNRAFEAGDPHKADVGALMWQHLPLSVVEDRAVVHDGELPLWNRYDSAGLPLLGQGQSCFGDPLHMIPVLADGASWAWDLKFLLAKWIFAGALGACVWRMFRHLPTAILTTVSVPFLGFFVFRINHPAVFSLCYAPLILYVWLRCVEAGTVRGAALWLAALIGANWMEMNSGTAKEAYALLFSMNFSGLCLLAAGGRPRREKRALLAGLVGAGVLFAMVASPIWYTFYRALGASYTSYNVTETFQIQPGMLLGLFDEAFYRPFQFQSGVINPSANAFILIGVIWVGVRWRALLADRRAAALALSALPALALVFGVVPPGLIARVPFLRNIMHVDNTFSCALIVLLCVLSGLGWREAWGRLASREGAREAALVVAVVLALFCAFLGTAQSVLRSAYAPLTWGRTISVEPFVHGYGWSLVAGAALFLWALGRMRARGAATPAMLLCAFTAFGAFHWREALRTGAGFADYVVRPGARIDLLGDSPAIDFVRSHPGEPSRAVGFHNDLLPGWSGVYGVEGISGPDALMNPYYRDLMETAGMSRIWDWRYIVEPPDAARLKPVLDMLGVRDYVGYRMGANRPGRELDLAASADMDVYESRAAWPRAFFTDSVAVYGDTAQYCSWVKAGDGRPFAGIQQGDWAALVPAPRVHGDLAKRAVSAAANYRLTSNTTSFTVSATGPGFIVLTEAYERGNFRATVNGRPAPYIRINHAFKGIYVDSAGTYQVRYEYWPAGFSAAIAMSAAGLVLLAAALLFATLRAPTAAAARRP